MLFNSAEFLGFLLFVLLLYHLPLLRRVQVPLLILSSLFFYAYDQPVLVLLLLLSILINTLSSYRVIRAGTQATRLGWAWAGVLGNLLLLVLYKYGPLTAQSLGLREAPPGSLGQWLLSLPLPLGISFFTFQGISLVVDVYRHTDKPLEARAMKSFWHHARDTAFFKAFFPQLVAGPIMKAHEFYPQIETKDFKSINWGKALETLILGYFFKVVVADNLKEFTVWLSFPELLRHSTADLIFLLFAYSIQIFADFAGYSLIAIGLARMFGYELITNFQFPYLSRSLSEFWRRWHISLSSWLRDYLYIPLGGNRKGPLRTYCNLMLVMVLGGLWHGASWTYAFWGLYHGAGLCIERGLSRLPLPSNILWSIAKAGMVFLFVSLGWMLFRMKSLEELAQYFKALQNNTAMESNYTIQYLILAYAAPIIVYHWYYLRFQRHGQILPPWTKAATLGLCLFLLATNRGNAGAFIYFQF